MAISFACQCGKPLQAPDHFAGRKMRCPACGTVLTIPGGVASAAPATVASPAVNAPVRTAVLPTPAAPIPTRKNVPALVADATEVMDAPAVPRRAARPDDDIVATTVAADDDEVMATEEAEDKPQMLVRRRPKKQANRQSANPWMDPALGQNITPWPAGDRDRVGAIPERERGGRGKWLLLVLVLLVGGAAAAIWTFGADIKKTLDANDRDVQKQVMRQQK